MVDCTLVTRRKGLAGALAGAVIAISVGLPATSASAATVFTSGTFVLPEGISPAPGGGYLVSDADNDAIYLVPATGGTPTAQQATNFRTFGEVQLPAGYSHSGTYLAYGTNTPTSTNGVAALVGTTGIAPPTPVINTANAFYTTAAVAPSSYGTIVSGSVVLGNNPGGVGASTSTIEVLKPDLSGTTTFTTLTGIDAFGVGFAPASFGAHAGQLFVSDVASGNLYTVSQSGQASLFATLPLPAGFNQPGLRQFAWAPASFGAYGGDLFVSIAAQNGGGGSTGEIDVLNASGQTVALYAVGTAMVPVDPRGLLFIGNNELLVANADPGIVQASPSDFLPAAEVLPEPGTLGVLLAGLIGLGVFRRRPFSAGQAAGPPLQH
jgi:hypothetical protein